MLFQLRDQHMRAFEALARDNFVERTCRHLRQVLPEQTAPYSDEQLRRRIEVDSQRARAYGLTWERSIVRFVETGFLLGANFDRNPDYPWVNPLLTSKDHDQDDRSLVLVMVAYETAKSEGRQGV